MAGAEKSINTLMQLGDDEYNLDASVTKAFPPSWNNSNRPSEVIHPMLVNRRGSVGEDGTVVGWADQPELEPHASINAPVDVLPPTSKLPTQKTERPNGGVLESFAQPHHHTKLKETSPIHKQNGGPVPTAGTSSRRRRARYTGAGKTMSRGTGGGARRTTNPQAPARGGRLIILARTVPGSATAAPNAAVANIESHTPGPMVVKRGVDTLDPRVGPERGPMRTRFSPQSNKDHHPTLPPALIAATAATTTAAASSQHQKRGNQSTSPSKHDRVLRIRRDRSRPRKHPLKGLSLTDALQKWQTRAFPEYYAARAPLEDPTPPAIPCSSPTPAGPPQLLGADRSGGAATPPPRPHRAAPTPPPHRRPGSAAGRMASSPHREGGGGTVFTSPSSHYQKQQQRVGGGTGAAGGAVPTFPTTTTQRKKIPSSPSPRGVAAGRGALYAARAGGGGGGTSDLDHLELMQEAREEAVIGRQRRPRLAKDIKPPDFQIVGIAPLVAPTAPAAMYGPTRRIPHNSLLHTSRESVVQFYVGVF